MIPVYLQSFKAPGIYRVVFDKSTIEGVDSEILRLVVGYSEKGAFNCPTYITTVTDFKAFYGDISKKLEKRGVFFHRLALQALASGPILCLNLKKFENETVDGATINTAFNPSYEIIEDVKLSVEDIYDTSRFWTLDAEKLNDLKAVDGSILDQYINICTTNTKDTSGTYFIRKASGSKVAQYNLTVSDWYSDNQDEMPDFLEPYQNSLISDFFAEIYVFGTKFTPGQVLASSTLKKYFEVATENGQAKVDENGNVILQLVDHVENPYGDWVDTLDELYKDETSHAIGHYVGCLIPEFKDKKGNYASLDIAFNQEQNEHNMMMSFNTDMIYEEETASIDLSGRLSISQSQDSTLNIEKLFDGTATTNLLGNNNAKVITNKVKFINNVVKYNNKSEKYEAIIGLNESPRKVMGTLYVSNFDPSEDNTTHQIEIRQIGSADKITIKCEDTTEMWQIGLKLGAAYEVSKNTTDAIEVEINNVVKYVKQYEAGYGTYYPVADDEEAIQKSPFIDEEGNFKQEGPQKVITSIARIEPTNNTAVYTDLDKNMKISLLDVIVTMENIEDNSVYGASITFIPVADEWDVHSIKNGTPAAISSTIYENTLYSILQVGDCLVADDGTNEDAATDGFYDNVYVQNVDVEYDADGNISEYYITFSGIPYVYETENGVYLVRIEGGLNQEIGSMIPKYLEGYTYSNAKPESSSMISKLNWQKFLLSTLTEYKGLRTGLLNKSDIDYRYVVDTFDSYVDSSLKKVLSYLCKEKENAFAILNFPAVKTFTKCPYTSFTNENDVFDVNYIVTGYNKKKATAIKFSLPEDNEGASFCAFYTPLKYSDGFVDTIVPSAALVSNLFMKKYTSRQPYYIVAGPKYARIKDEANGLIGPDYNYSKEELNILDPYGVNAIVFKKGFGTFVNSNQTAKQTPVSALSKVNIRELVIYLQDEIEKILQDNQWEFNNPVTRNAILDRANYICGRVAANGGIEAYQNIMDESNNTNEIIENEFGILSTSIEPGFGCGKLVQELTIYRRGMLKATIKD